MKILFLEQYAEAGGAQRCLLDLLPGVRAAGWEAHVALPEDGPLTPLLRERGAQVHFLSLGRYPSGRKSLADGIRFVANLPALAGEIRTLADRIGAALLYVNGPRLLPAVTAVRRPILFHAHSAVPAASGGTLARTALRRSGAGVIAVSRFLAERWRRPAQGPVRVIYSGVEGPPTPLLARTPGGPRVGLIGRIHPQKGQKELVLAARELASARPEAEFVLCGAALFGDPRAERYQQEVLSLAPPSVRYLGWRDDVYGVLADLDLLVVPSAEEGGVPRVILEAFAARVPVLALESGAIPEFIVDGENGFLLASATAAQLAARLNELLPQRERLRSVAAAGQRTWRERFTADRYRAEVLAAISEAVSPSSRRKTTAESSPSKPTARSGRA
jgi:glycosyltransferase involved in cell wall biosynthesis